MPLPPSEAPVPPAGRSPADRRQRRERGLRLSRRLTRGALALSAAMVFGFSALAAVSGGGHATPATAGISAPGSQTQDDTEPGRTARETAQESTTEARPERNDDSTAITPGEDTGGSSASSSSAPTPSTQAPAVTSGAS